MSQIFKVMILDSLTLKLSSPGLENGDDNFSITELLESYEKSSSSSSEVPPIETETTETNPQTDKPPLNVYIQEEFVKIIGCNKFIPTDIILMMNMGLSHTLNLVSNEKILVTMNEMLVNRCWFAFFGECYNGGCLLNRMTDNGKLYRNKVRDSFLSDLKDGGRYLILEPGAMLLELDTIRRYVGEPISITIVHYCPSKDYCSIVEDLVKENPEKDIEQIIMDIFTKGSKVSKDVSDTPDGPDGLISSNDNDNNENPSIFNPNVGNNEDSSEEDRRKIWGVCETLTRQLLIKVASLVDINLTIQVTHNIDNYLSEHHQRFDTLIGLDYLDERVSVISKFRKLMLQIVRKQGKLRVISCRTGGLVTGVLPGESRLFYYDEILDDCSDLDKIKVIEDKIDNLQREREQYITREIISLEENKNDQDVWRDEAMKQMNKNYRRKRGAKESVWSEPHRNHGHVSSTSGNVSNVIDEKIFFSSHRGKDGNFVKCYFNNALDKEKCNVITKEITKNEHELFYITHFDTKHEVLIQ